MLRRGVLLAVAAALLLPGSMSAQKGKQKMVILLLGAPGSGKTTQAKNLSRKYKIPSISMAEILNKEAGWVNTKLKKGMKANIASGDLVNDEMANSLIQKYTSQKKALNGFILDGYPLTAVQAKYFEDVLLRQGLPDPVVVHLNVPDHVAIERMDKRGRADDKPDIIERRMSDYHAEAKFILEHYKGERLKTVDGTPAPAQVWSQIQAALKEFENR